MYKKLKNLLSLSYNKIDQPSQANGSDSTNDYMSLEKDPHNLSMPRLIKLSLKVNFTSL